MCGRTYICSDVNMGRGFGFLQDSSQSEPSRGAASPGDDPIALVPMAKPKAQPKRKGGAAPPEPPRVRITGTGMSYKGFRCCKIFVRGTRRHTGWEICCNHDEHQEGSGCRKTCNFVVKAGDRTEEQVLEWLYEWATGAAAFENAHDHNKEGWKLLMQLVRRRAREAEAAPAAAAAEPFVEPPPLPPPADAPLPPPPIWPGAEAPEPVAAAPAPVASESSKSSSSVGSSSSSSDSEPESKKAR